PPSSASQRSRSSRPARACGSSAPARRPRPPFTPAPRPPRAPSRRRSSRPSWPTSRRRPRSPSRRRWSARSIGPRRPPPLRAPVPAPAVVLTRPADATALTDDAIRLYAAGQLARACDRFSEAAGERPDSAARREDVGRCFETWGWRTLAQGRPEEAALLFGQGLAAVPDDPALLKAAGVAAVHAGRVDDALGPLEAAARLRADAQVR